MDDLVSKLFVLQSNVQLKCQPYCLQSIQFVFLNWKEDKEDDENLFKWNINKTSKKRQRNFSSKPIRISDTVHFPLSFHFLHIRWVSYSNRKYFISFMSNHIWAKINQIFYFHIDVASCSTLVPKKKKAPISSGEKSMECSYVILFFSSINFIREYSNDESCLAPSRCKTPVLYWSYGDVKVIK